MRLIKIIVVSILFYLPFAAEASHMMGAEITYRCLGNKQYEITARVYRDCRGIPFNNPSITVTDYNGKTISLSYTRVSIEDITPRCDDSSTGPCNPSNNTVSNEGVELHTFLDTIDFSVSPYNYFQNNGVCKVYFTLEQCCRNGDITTINPGNFYIEAMLDICKSNFTNTSPQFKGRNVLFANCNFPFRQNLGAKDFVEYDSVSFELVNPLNAANTNETYNGSFSPTVPMSPYCVPSSVINCKAVPGATPPRGFYFNNQNGDLIFTPTKCNEVGVISMQATEYRKNSSSGQWEIVGYIKRDIQIVVQSLNLYNKIPQVKLLATYNFTTRKKTCIDIATYDTAANGATSNNKGDATTLSIIELPLGATFAYVDSSARLKKGRLCWQPHDSIYLKLKTTSKLIPLTAEVKDNFCYTPEIVQKGFNIRLLAPDSSGYLGINTFIDRDKNGIKSTGEKNRSVGLKFKDKYSAYYIATDTAGLFGDSIGIGNVTIGVAQHPYYEATTKDTTVKIKMDSAHALSFGFINKAGIYGRIYEDANGNCKYDKGEMPYSGYKVFTDSNKYVGISDKNGVYYIKAPAGSYTLTCDFKPLFVSVNCPVAKTISISINGDSAYLDNDFGVSKNKDFKDVSVGIHVGRLRRGFGGKVTVMCTNNGFVTRKNVTLQLPVNSNFGLYYNSTLYANAGTTASIAIDSILPSQTFKKTFDFLVDANKFQSKDEICFTLRTDSTATAEDSLKADNTAIGCRIVDAPYDPNNKLITSDTAKTTLDRSINYTVQFQNTGTDTATRVVVRDTVDTKYLSLDLFNLDWSDYPCETIIEGNVIHFIFDNINLPTFAKSGDKSIGAFNFTLGLKPNIAVETAVKNSVAIYFDFEKPVITKPAIATINNPITIKKVNAKSFCVNVANRIAFSSRVALQTGNKMIVELSDANGSFTSPIALNSKFSTSITDSLDFTLPKGLNGGNHTLRIRSTNPAAVSVPTSGVVIITALDKPSYLINSNLNNNSICENDTLNINFTNTSYLYKVLKNNVQLSNFNSVFSYQLPMAGKDSFDVIALDNSTGCKDTLNIRPVILKRPTIQASITNRKAAYCSAESMVINGSGAQYYVYLKNNAILGNKTASSSFTTQLDNSGTYRIKGEGSNGCSNLSDTMMITVNPLPSATLNIAPTPLCDVDSATLQFSNDFNKDLFKNNQLLLDNTTLTKYAIKNVVQGDYYQLKSMTDKGCAKNSPVITIAIFPVPQKPVITASGDNLNVSAFTGTIAWYRNNQLLSNTGTTLNNAPSGVYHVVFTSNDGCSSTSDNYTHVNVSVKKIEAKEITVYPNPAGNWLAVQTSSIQITTVEIVSISGQLIQSYETTGTSIKVNTENIADGFYILRCMDEHGNFAIFKIQINHLH
ncbi:MAG: T9SS type A sorting domain-containing protein [Bacteroidota bacterium]